MKRHTLEALAAHVHIYAPATAGAPCCNCSCVLLQTAEACHPFHAWVAALHEPLQQTAESNMSQHMTAFRSRPLEITSLILDRRRPHGRGKNDPCAAAVPPPLPTRQTALAHKQHVLGHTPYFVPSHTLLGAGSRKPGPNTLEYTSATLAHQQEAPPPVTLLNCYHKLRYQQAAHPCSRAGPIPRHRNKHSALSA